LLSFARAENATQIGARRQPAIAARSTFSGLGIGATTIRDSGDIDVHIVTHRRSARAGSRAARGALSVRTPGAGIRAGGPCRCFDHRSLMAVQDAFNYTSDVLAYLLAVIVVALVGGLVAGAS
jgi:two-component system sensor histidine kinase KdpD